MARLPDGATLGPAAGGLSRLTLAAREAEVHVYLHGAHVTHFQPSGERPLLWLSAHSLFAPGKPIRGGVPVCFPWFGPNPDDPGAPLHGFARLREWTLVAVEEDAQGALVATLELRSDAETRRLFPHEFRLRLSVAAGRELLLRLTTENADQRSFGFTEALHSYLAVGDVRRIALLGLAGASYVDKTDGGARKTQGKGALAIEAETDRVFTGHVAPITIEDPAFERRLLVERTGSRTAVVWNPWIAKAQAMPDFGDDEWTGMVCVESANALDDAITLDPGARHELATTITVSSSSRSGAGS